MVKCFFEDMHARILMHDNTQYCQIFNFNFSGTCDMIVYLLCSIWSKLNSFYGLYWAFSFSFRIAFFPILIQNGSLSSLYPTSPFHILNNNPFSIIDNILIFSLETVYPLFCCCLIYKKIPIFMKSFLFIFYILLF